MVEFLHKELLQWFSGSGVEDYIRAPQNERNFHVYLQIFGFRYDEYEVNIYIG